MKIFLTGATGFIGSHILTRLIKENHQVFIFLRDNSDMWRIQELLNDSNIKKVYSDDLEEYFKTDTPDTVIHLATCYKKHHTPQDIGEMVASNIDFPTRILQLSKDFGVKSFINTGTFFEIDFENGDTIDELYREKAYNLYAATKLAFKQMCHYYHEYGDINILNFILFSPYGEKDNEKLIPTVIKKLLRDEEMSLVDQNLCFTYVRDIVEAYIL